MKRILFLFIFIFCFHLLAYAHPGGTDSNGGHYDRNTGEYHYHHGYPAHKHLDGICPYEETEQPSREKYNNFHSSVTDPDSNFLNDIISNNLRESKVPSVTNTKPYKTQTAEDKSSNKADYENADILTTPQNKITYSGVRIEYFIIIIGSILFFGYIGIRTYVSSTKEKIRALESKLSSHEESSTDFEVPAVLYDYNQLKDDYDILQEKYIEAVNSRSALLHYDESQLQQYKSKILNITTENESLKSDIYNLKQQIHNMELMQKDLQNCNDLELMKIAKVPPGVTFDGNLLPHYYCNNVVEKNFHVYISDGGKCYHRKKYCSKASTPVHLFSVADHMLPCQRCIPLAAQNYKIPAWYYRYLKLLRNPDLASKNTDGIRYQFSDTQTDGIEELKN